MNARRSRFHIMIAMSAVALYDGNRHGQGRTHTK